MQSKVIVALRHLAIDEHLPVSELLEEAIIDVLAKYGRALPTGKEKGGVKKSVRR